MATDLSILCEECGHEFDFSFTDGSVVFCKNNSDGIIEITKKDMDSISRKRDKHNRIKYDFNLGCSIFDESNTNQICCPECLSTKVALIDLRKILEDMR